MALDGDSGEVAIDPTERDARRLAAARGSPGGRGRPRDEARRAGALQPATTADGVRIRLEANLEIADEVARVLDAGAEGIGLFRSEFLLDAAHPEAASEDAQYRDLSRAARRRCTRGR